MNDKKKAHKYTGADIKPIYETEYGKAIGATKENPFGKYKDAETF